MTKFRKLAAVLLSLTMIMCMFALPASAADHDDFEKLSDNMALGTKYSKVIGKKYNNMSGEYYSDHKAYYKIVLDKGGDLKLDVTIDGADQVFIDLYKQDGNQARPNDPVVSSGNMYRSGSTTYCRWKDSGRVISGSITFKDLKKGTFYLRFTGVEVSSVDPTPYYTHANGRDRTGTINVTATSGSTSSSSSSSTVTTTTTTTTTSSDIGAYIESFTITMKKGTSMKLGTNIVGTTSQSIKWSSSKSSVVSVNSSGKITAKAAGTAVISAKLGNNTTKIKVKVTK